MENILQRKLSSNIFKFFILLFMVISPSLYASEIDLQQVIKEKKVTINVKGKTLDEILLMITKQTTIGYGYSGVEPNNNEKYNLNVTDETVEKALNTLLSGTKYNYFIANNKIVISKRALITKENEKITVKGIIIDENNKPIVGATILVEGTTNGSISSGDGAFSINTTKGANLEVSYTGCKTMKETVNESNANLVIKLYPDIMAVDEVVVTGYQNVNRRDMVGSFTTIKADEIKLAGTNNILDMLQGQVAGMIVTNSSGRAGASPTIKIRGTATFGSTDPIYVVDGIIQPDPLELPTGSMTDDLRDIIGNQLSWLNPDDIDTITVLKDASATAIYGSRASNGVIVITTKKPKMGDRMSISYSGNLSISPQPKYSQFNFMNSQERIVFSEEAFAEGARYGEDIIPDNNSYEGIYFRFLNGTISEDYYLKRKAELEGMNTDWFDLLTRTAITQSHNLSLSGASEKATYRFSMGYSKVQGTEKGNDTERLSANANIGMSLHPKVKVNFILNASMGNTKGFGPEVNPLRYATTTSRAIPAYEENGEFAYNKQKNSYKYNNEEYLKYNILNELKYSDAKIGNNSVNASMSLTWKIIDWLSYEFTGGGSYSTSERASYAGEQTFYIAKQYRGYDFNSIDPTNPLYKAALLPRGGEMFQSNGINQAYNIQNKVIINKQFNDNNRLNVMIAMEVRSTISSNSQEKIYGLSRERGNQIIKPTTPEEFKPIKGSINGFLILNDMRQVRQQIENNYVSYFATAAYTFKNRYVLNANARNDLSNRFGQDTNSRFDPTYSFGLGWRVSEEPWMESLNKVFTNVNFKATFGIQGNANLKTSPDLILTSSAGLLEPFKDFGSQINSIPNPNLSWERTKSWDFGLDLSLFGKFSLMVDYYRRSSNAVVSKKIPYFNGKESMNINGGQLYNRGVEFTVSFSPIQKKDFSINLSLNSSRNWNEGGNAGKDYGYGTYLSGLGDNILKEGYPINSIWSFDYAGLNGVDGQPTFRKLDISAEEAKIDPTLAMIYTGTNEPNFSGGLNLNIKYKKFTLSSGFVLMVGGYKRLPNPYEGFRGSSYLPSAFVNLKKDLNNRWRKPGDEAFTDIPSIDKAISNISTPFGGLTRREVYTKSSALTVSSSFFRCRDINLNYSLSGKALKKVGLNSLRIGASVTNVFVIASDRFNGFDPELGDSVKPQGYSLSLSFGF